MTKRKTVILCSIFSAIAVIVIIVVIWNNRAEQKNDFQQMNEMVDRIENAICEVDDSYKKQFEVVSFPIIYSDAEGNTIVFTQCHTKYLEGDPTEVTGLNIESLQSVVELPEEHRDCVVNGWSAAWFEKDDLAYLCWTISPEISCILEYNPDTVSDTDIFKMAESVQEQTEE